MVGRLARPTVRFLGMVSFEKSTGMQGTMVPTRILKKMNSTNDSVYSPEEHEGHEIRVKVERLDDVQGGSNVRILYASWSEPTPPTRSP